jgi:hypothetical protein
MLVSSAPVARADSRDFTLWNRSDQYIWYVYVSPSEKTSWGDDVMGSDVLAPDSSVFIYFTGNGGCTYDIKVVGGTGDEGYLYNVDLCATSTVTFS